MLFVFTKLVYPDARYRKCEKQIMSVIVRETISYRAANFTAVVTLTL